MEKFQVCQSTLYEVLYAQAPGEPRQLAEADILDITNKAFYAQVPTSYNENGDLCVFVDDSGLDAAEAAIRAAGAEAMRGIVFGHNLCYAESRRHPGYVVVAAIPDEAVPADEPSLAEVIAALQEQAPNY